MLLDKNLCGLASQREDSSKLGRTVSKSIASGISATISQIPLRPEYDIMLTVCGVHLTIIPLALVGYEMIDSQRGTLAIII